jgi:2'-5' RNA ligase
MVAALELYFDPAATRRVSNLWSALDDAGIQSMRSLFHGRHRPHLSLTGAPELDGPAIATALEGLDVAPPLQLRLEFIGQFVGRVLWLGPVPSTGLLAHHVAVHERLDAAGIASSAVYRPGAWVPHVTLSMRVPHSQMAAAIRLCMDVLPIEATVVGAGVADYARGLYTALTPARATATATDSAAAQHARLYSPP